MCFTPRPSTTPGEARWTTRIAGVWRWLYGIVSVKGALMKALVLQLIC